MYRDAGPDNEDRRRWARVALDAFGAETGQTDYDYRNPEHLIEIGGDLICNLLHLADQAGMDPEVLLEKGRDHHDEEVAEQGGDDG